MWVACGEEKETPEKPANSIQSAKKKKKAYKIEIFYTRKAQNCQNRPKPQECIEHLAESMP